MPSIVATANSKARKASAVGAFDSNFKCTFRNLVFISTLYYRNYDLRILADIYRIVDLARPLILYLVLESIGFSHNFSRRRLLAVIPYS